MAEIFRIQGSITGLVSAPGQPDYLYILFQTGLIVRYNKKIKNFDETILDLRPEIDALIKAKPKQSKFDDERGLLGLVFHPEFSLKGSLFEGVFIAMHSQIANESFYDNLAKLQVPDPDHMTCIVQYVYRSNQNAAQTKSTGKYLICLPKPQFNHNGGAMVFDQNGYLLIGSGDGGGSNDEHGPLLDPNDKDSYLGFSQNLQTYLGKILRIQIVQPMDQTASFFIPSDNPLISSQRPAIAHWGFRNPWSFDLSPDGNLFVGDVGQNRLESVKLVDAKLGLSQNHGWRAIEGKEIFNQKVYDYVIQSGQKIILPIIDYPRDDGIAVTGVHYVSKLDMPQLTNSLIIVDYKGTIMQAKLVSDVWTYEIIKKIDYMIHRLGVDKNDNDHVYILAYDRKVNQSIIVSLNKLLNNQETNKNTNEQERLTDDDIQKIIDQGIRMANRTKSKLRGDNMCKMHFSIIRRGDEQATLVHSMPDAWAGSADISKRKAYTTMAFSSNENALTTRTIGSVSQPGKALWQIGNSNSIGGIIEFPGGLPLYKNGQLVGGIGVSGDGVDIDEKIAMAASYAFQAPYGIRSDVLSGLIYTKQ